MFSGLAFWNVDVACSGALIPLTSLGAYYKFNSNSLDSSGGGLNGTNVGSPTYTTGKFNDAISLNGTGQYVSVSDSTRLEGLSGNISVFGWVNITDYASDGNPHLASKIQASTGWRIVARSTDLLVSIGATNNSRGTGVATGVFTHIGFTYNNSIVKIYQNGVQIGTDVSIGARTLANTQAMNISRRNAATDGYLKGLIDDLAIWQRVLTPTQIATLYDSTCPLNT